MGSFRNLKLCCRPPPCPIGDGCRHVHASQGEEFGLNSQSILLYYIKSTHKNIKGKNNTNPHNNNKNGNNNRFNNYISVEQNLVNLSKRFNKLNNKGRTLSKVIQA